MAFATLMARLGLDQTLWKKGLHQAEMTAQSAGSRIAAGLKSRFIGAMGAAAIGGAMKRAMDEAGRIRDESMRLGMVPSLFQELDFAARQTATSIESVATAIRTAAKLQIDALKGGPESDAARVYARLGVTFEQLKTMRAPDIFLQIGRHLKGATINTLLLDDAMTAFGSKSGLDVLPMMIAGLDALRDSAQQLGNVLGDPDTFKLADLGDRFTTFTGRIQKQFSGVLSAAISIGEAMQDWVDARIISKLNYIGAFAKAIWKGKSIGEANFEALKSYFDVRNKALLGIPTRKEMIMKSASERAKLLGTPTEDIEGIVAKREMEKSSAAAEHIFSATIPSDALTAIGNFLGSSMRNDMERRSLDKLTRIEQHTGRMSRLIEQPDTGTQFP